MTNPNDFDEQLRAGSRDYNRPGDVPHERMWARIEEARAAARNPVAPLHAAPDRAARPLWLRRVAAAAAVLIVGFGVGRLYERMRTSPVETAQTTPRVDSGRSRGAPESTATVPRSTGTQDPQTRVAQRSPSETVLDPVRSPRRDDRAVGSESPDRGMARNGTSMAYRLAMLQHLAGTEAMLISFRAAAKHGDVDEQLTTWARDLLTTTRLMQSSPVATDPTMKRLLDDLELVLVQIAQYTAKGEHRAEELDLIEHSIERRGVLPKLRTTIPAGTSTAGT